MKKTLLFLSLITISWAYSMEEGSSIPRPFQEKKVVLCNGDTCVQATITPYDADRDHADVRKLIDENQLKLPQITLELLAPYFSHKIESFESPSPGSLPVAGSLAYSTEVLRDSEKVLGFVSYITSSMQQPTPTIAGNIAFLSVDPAYQDAGEEQLLKHVLQDMSHKKSVAVNIMMHEDNAVQRATVEKMGFVDNSQQIKMMAERLSKSNSAQQTAAEPPKTQSHCYYMKVLEENVTEEMKNPTPIESSLLNLTKANFEQEVLNADRPVAIDVYTNWCGPCRHFAPIFEEVAATHTAYKFIRFNCVEEEQELAKKLGIEVFPTIVFIKDGKVVGKETGFMSKEILQQKLTKQFN